VFGLIERDKISCYSPNQTNQANHRNLGPRQLLEPADTSLAHGQDYARYRLRSTIVRFLSLGLLVGLAAASPTIEVKDSKSFTSNGNQFFVKGMYTSQHSN
jgi:hypothetical protein